MNSFKNEILSAGHKLASVSDLSVSEPSDSFIEVYGPEIGLRMRWQIDRIDGVFVTLFKKDDPITEYSITYLIEYEEGSSQDIESSNVNDVRLLLVLIHKYAEAFLRGTLDKFVPFERYAQRRICEQTPETPDIKVSKWVRPRWILYK